MEATSISVIRNFLQRHGLSAIRAKSGADICHCQVKFGSMVTRGAGEKFNDPLFDAELTTRAFSRNLAISSLCNHVGSTAVGQPLEAVAADVVCIALDMKLFAPSGGGGCGLDRSIDNLEDARRLREIARSADAAGGVNSF